MKFEHTSKKILFLYDKQDKNNTDNLESGSICLHMCNTNEPYSSEDASSYLSEEEYQYYGQRKNPKRKREVFWSRIMAKLAVKDIAHLPEEEMESIHISKGHMQNPLVKGTHGQYQVSITHCPDYAGAVAYPEELLIGLDMEAIQPDKQEGIYEILTDRERRMCPEHMERELYAMVLWTAKEALVKCLKLGLSVSFEIMQVSGLQKADPGFRSSFRYFPGLEAYTAVEEDIVYTIVYPNDVNFRKA